MQIWKSILCAALLAGSLNLPTAANAGPNCTCRHQGGDVPEGATACIGVSGNMQLARCERVLNNTSWKMLEQPCPFANIVPHQGESMTVARLNSELLVDSK